MAKFSPTKSDCVFISSANKCAATQSPLSRNARFSASFLPKKMAWYKSAFSTTTATTTKQYYTTGGTIMRYEPKILHRLLRTREWRARSQIRRGEGGHPDPEIKGVGGGEPGLPKNCFRPFGPQFGLKIRGGGGPPAPPLDPPLQENEKRMWNEFVSVRGVVKFLPRI